VAAIRSGGILGAELEIYGLDDLLSELEQVSPKLRRAFERDIREATGTVAAAAARQVRTRTGATAAGYKVSRRAGAHKIVNTTRGGAILEFAAVPHSKRGTTLVATLNEVYGKPGRILWDSWDTVEPWVTQRLYKLVEDAEFEIERAGI
jgi:hypothetical protein